MKELLCLVFVLICGNTYGQEFKAHIVFLASDSMQGREPLSKYEKIAAQYIFKEFSKAKCNRIIFQKFPLQMDSAINVVGYIDNKKDSTIIITAHYDGLGFGADKSREVVKKGIHNGADDNASGVSLMIELSKAFSNSDSAHNFQYGKSIKQPNYNFVFVAYSAHESGLYGSSFFEKSDLYQALKVRMVINFDMVGRLDSASKILRISGAESDTLFRSYFSSLSNPPFVLRFDDSYLLQSDLKPFVENGIPAINFSTGLHGDYHKISDDESKINYEGMRLVYDFIYTFIVRFI